MLELHEVVPLFKTSGQVDFVEMGECIGQDTLALLGEQCLLTVDIDCLVCLGLVQLSNVVVQLINGTNNGLEMFIQRMLYFKLCDFSPSLYRQSLV